MWALYIRFDDIFNGYDWGNAFLKEVILFSPGIRYQRKLAGLPSSNVSSFNATQDPFFSVTTSFVRPSNKHQVEVRGQPA